MACAEFLKGKTPKGWLLPNTAVYACMLHGGGGISGIFFFSSASNLDIYY
jgi:hypothetical protein